MAGRKSTGRRRNVPAVVQHLEAAVQRIAAAVLRLFQHSGPAVIVDGPIPQARRLRRLVGNSAIVFTRTLGAAAPENLVIVVQRAVHEGRPLNGALKTFEPDGGSKRYLLLLALSVQGRQVSDEDLLVALRSGLIRVMADSLGEASSTVAIELDVPRARQAPVVELRNNGNHPASETERGAIPIQRIGDNNHA